MIRITVYSGPSTTDERPPAVSTRTVADVDVDDELRKIGIEWRTADYMPQRQVVITLDPVTTDDERAKLRANVRAAAEYLEQTGLL